VLERRPQAAEEHSSTCLPPHEHILVSMKLLSFDTSYVLKDPLSSTQCHFTRHLPPPPTSWAEVQPLPLPLPLPPCLHS
jgi:hypothetical protein